MDHRLKLLILGLVLSGSCAATYVYPSRPAYYGPVTGGGVAGQSGVTISPGDVVRNGTVYKPSGLSVNVGGKPVVMPAAYRFASNVGQFAASAALRLPWLFIGSMALSELYKWYQENNLEVNSSGTEWQYKTTGPAGYLTPGAPAYHPTCGSTVPCPDGWVAYKTFPPGGYMIWTLYAPDGRTFVAQYPYTVVPGQVTTQPAIITNFPLEIPLIKYDELVSEFPAEFGPIPVQRPILNPTPDNYPPVPGSPYPVPVPSPLAEPYPQPLRVPVGDPLPVPNTNPQIWQQPVVDIVPSPTVNEPFRVDVVPKSVEKTSPTPIIDPVTVPVALPGSPSPTTDTTVPKVDQPPGMCDLYPEILACAKDSTEADVPIETKDVSITLTPDSGWSAGGGSCPASRPLRIAGAEFSFSLLCDFFTGIRPVVIAVAYLGAAAILIGARGGAEL